MNRFRQENQDKAKRQPDLSRPLREFNHLPRDDTNQVRRHRFEVTVYWLLPIIVFVVIIGIAALIVFKFNAQNETSTDKGDQTTFFTPSYEISVPELFNAYLEAMGGRDALNQVRSVRYEGRVLFESRESDFQMLLLLPDKGMLVTNPGEADSLKLMLNGDLAWQVDENRDGAREFSKLGEKGTESLKWSLRVHNTFRRLALSGQYSEVSLREIEYLGKPCYEVTEVMPNGSDFSAVLDKETFYLLKTEETLSGQDRIDKFTVLYDDHRMVSGVIEPYETELYRDGNLDNKVMINSIQMNTGVISSLFEVPDEIRQ